MTALSPLRQSTRVAPSTQRLLIWWLVVALLAYTQSASIVRLQGSEHRHAPAATHEPGAAVAGILQLFQDLRAWRAQLRARLLAVPDAAGVAHIHAGDLMPSEHTHRHRHGDYERHHHDRDDPSVVALDGLTGDANTDAGTLTATGSALLPLATGPRWLPPGVTTVPLHWPLPERLDRWSDASLQLPDKPPRL